MSMSTRFSVPTALAAALSLAAVGYGQDSAQVRTQAEQILKQTGVQGGLIVHVGCGSGELTAALGAAEGYLVQGLDRDAHRVDEAREHIASLGRYGRVSARQLRGDRLPYATGMVNLVVVERPDRIPTEEVQRVLSPGGVAYVRQGDGWRKTVKPRDEKTDEWTHVLHGPDGNAVADDTVVGPPERIQWVSAPRQARAHEHLASVSALVSAGGRIFSIEDHGPAASVLLPPKWFLVARDAFNGVVLWKRPVGPWQSPLTTFRAGPVTLARRLIAIGDRVYATAGFGKPLQAIDAASGQTIHTYEATEGTTEVLYRDGLLFVVVDKGDARSETEAARRRGRDVPPGQQQIRVIRADTGKLVWNKADADTAEAMPMTLATNGRQVFFQNPDAVLCLDTETGSQQWRAERPVARVRPPWSAPTLVVYDDVLLSADRATPDDVERDPSRVHPTKWLDAPRGELIAFSVRTGEKLWSAPCREGFHAPVDVLVADGLVWSGELVVAREPGFTVGRDPHTGEIKRQRPADDTFFQIGMPHHRCHRNRATSRYLVLGRAGVELVNLATGEAIANHWVRGTCQFGTLPCNGLIYAPPHACACYIEAKLNAFYALAPRARTSRSEAPAPNGPAGESLSRGANDPGQLERGPAYARVQKRQPAPLHPDDWPTYRHDAARSGRTSAAVADHLKQRWKSRLRGKLASRSKPDKKSPHNDTTPTPSRLGPALTSLVAADGRVFVASKEDHTVHALDANDGTVLWQAMAGGRVDSPPTVYQGTVLFGSADGSVHCLDAATGELVWRFRSAAEERQVVAYGQLESTWPIHGSVLIEDGAVIFAAGRSSYLDGGIYFYRLDPRTGETLSQTRLTSRDSATGQQPEVTGMFDLPGVLPDVLSSDGQRIYMRHTALDREGNRAEGDHSHLFCPTGFLDSSWWHRSYWIWSARFYSGYRDWFRAGHEVPAGRPLVVDKTSIYGFARKPEYFYWSTAQEYQLFASKKDPELVESPVKRQRRLPAWGQRQIRYKWSQDIPIQARAMVLAGTTLFVAGPPNLIDEKKVKGRRNDPQVQATLGEQAKALANRKGGLLWAVAAKDGSKLAEYRLDFPPVWDGMIAASGRLFCATADGSVICFGPQ